MIVYDITDKNSFNNTKNWITQIKEYLGDSACITLVGNKLDLESDRSVSTEEAKKFSLENNLLFYEVSAKDNINVHFAFDQLSNQMIKHKKENYDIENKEDTNPDRSHYYSLVDKKKKHKASSCC